MKVSTILVFLFGGPALASADIDDAYLRRGLVVEPTGACLDLASISFSSVCTTTTVFTDVVEALETVECNNAAREEVLLLTGNATVSDARKTLQAKCQATRVKCIPDLYALDYLNCEDSTVMDTIATELLALNCDHNNRVEVLLQVEDAETVAAAKATIRTECVTTLEPCLGTLDSFTLTGVVCQANPIMDVVTTKIQEVGCTHSANREVMLLTDKTVGEAKRDLIAKCVDERAKCITDMNQIDFPNCTATTVMQTIADKLVAEECPHNNRIEVLLQTGLDTVAEARNSLVADCVETLEPCLGTLDSFSFSGVACQANPIMESLESQIPDSCTHSATREAMLLTEKVTVGEAKLDLITKCVDERVKCIDNIYALDYDNCESGTVMQTIADALVTEGCPHNNRIEVLLHTGLATVADARSFIEEECAKTLESCIGPKDSFTLTGVVCQAAPILDVVKAKMNETGCTHSVNQELLLLTELDSVGAARMDLIGKCVDERAKCITDMTQVDFPNCTATTVMQTIAENLAANNCPHNNRIEVLLQTNLDVVAAARDSIVDTCMGTLDKCLSGIGAIDFYPTNCQQGAILNQIQTLLDTTTTCSHDNRHEVQLLTGVNSFSEAMASLRATCEADRQPCASLSDVEVNACDVNPIVRAIRDNMADDCPHGINVELGLLLNAADRAEAEDNIHTMCTTAWEQVPTSTFENIVAEFIPDFMNEYTAGDTFLNTETSNFQGDDNPLYPSDDRTRQVGQNINEFRNGLGQTSILGDVGTLDSCEHQSMFCCFGRDRQSNDDNGDCSDANCADQGPADNSNLCYVDLPEFMAYPGEDEATGGEGAVHCHGLAWDSDPNDPTARFRFNNFFFVSLYDHMYSRGYVENMIDSDFVPMCGCTEVMPKVARADCTQIDVDHTFLLNIDANGYLTSAPKQGSLTVNFNQCRGKKFGTNENANNDLASYVNKLVIQGRIDVTTQMKIYETLVGYAENDNDDNDAICSKAVADYTP